MIVCDKCNSENPDDASACGKCGVPLVATATIANMPDPEMPEPLWSSFREGRYEMKEVLGEGSTKKVYRAHDALLDRDVAIARIKAGLLDPGRRARLARGPGNSKAQLSPKHSADI